MMKKMLGWFGAAIMVGALAMGCGGSAKKAETTPPAPADGTAPADDTTPTDGTAPTDGTEPTEGNPCAPPNPCGGGK